MSNKKKRGKQKEPTLASQVVEALNIYPQRELERQFCECQRRVRAASPNFDQSVERSERKCMGLMTHDIRPAQTATTFSCAKPFVTINLLQDERYDTACSSQDENATDDSTTNHALQYGSLHVLTILENVAAKHVY